MIGIPLAGRAIFSGKHDILYQLTYQTSASIKIYQMWRCRYKSSLPGSAILFLYLVNI